MFKKIVDFEEIYERQEIAKILFNLELFKPGTTTFPQQVFNKKFHSYFFLQFNDWFNLPGDYDCLRHFVGLIKDHFYYADVPGYYLLNPMMFSANCSHQEFIDGFTYSFNDDTNYPAKNIGLRLSSQNFFYGENQTWAMVSDMTNNIVIVGLECNYVDDFKSAFADKYFTIEKVMENVEEYRGEKVVGADRIISRYS